MIFEVSKKAHLSGKGLTRWPLPLKYTLLLSYTLFTKYELLKAFFSLIKF